MDPVPGPPDAHGARPLDDLPLFATDAAVSAPASPPQNGKVVTLDELA
ncbi:MAG TPA: hypothetical protein VEL76_27630 [Gemmataceae bacterium]|nr:hypothetical protein [Gemmataceae bacterium]